MNAADTNTEEPSGKDRRAHIERAKARIDEYKDVFRDQHNRIREELRFSNPANPQQWDENDVVLRGKRPSLTLDRTNQFIQQVSNDIRQNNAGIQVIAADDAADPKVAEQLESVIRHIEYRSRAAIAYDTAADLAVRCGLGWIRVVPEELPDGTQDVRILRITDPCAAGIDLDCLEPDGYGAKWGYVETQMHVKTFQAQYPKAGIVPIGEEGWSTGDYVTIAEYFEIDEKTGKQTWCKLNGAELIEDPTEFPSQYLGLVPVIGYELWVDGKRHLCGLTRRLMDAQRLHNVEMSAMAEFLSSQPKSPFLVPAEAIQGYEKHWSKLNSGNPAFLPFNGLTAQGQPIPMPQRLMPPPMPGAYAQMAQFATEEMQASVGMYKANLGQQGNETSGRAIRARQMDGDVATLHFADNHGKSIAQLGRVIVDMYPRLKTERTAQNTVSVEGKRSFITVDPKMRRPVRLDRNGKVAAINPRIGTYDVCIKSGPSYTTMREETVQQIADMIQAQPNLAPILGPMWARMKDMPNSDKIAKLLLAMAPPQVQQLESDEDEIPPHVAVKMQAMQQQAQQAGEMMQAAASEIQRLREELESKRLEMTAKAAELEVRQYDAETKRLQVVSPAMGPEEIRAIVMQTMQDLLTQQPMGAPEMEAMPHAEPDADQLGGMPDMDADNGFPPEEPGEMPEAPPMAQPDEQGPPGPFSLPEEPNEAPE